MTDDATAFFDVQVPAGYFDIHVPAPDATWEEVDAAERAELRARVEAALERLRQVEDELEEIAIALDDEPLGSWARSQQTRGRHACSVTRVVNDIRSAPPDLALLGKKRRLFLSAAPAQAHII